MRVPDKIRITINAGGQPAAQMLVQLRFFTTHKNPYNSLFGPSDSHGIVHVTREQVLAQARNTENLFLMDYAGLESFWTGTLQVTPMNRDAIKRARYAYQLFHRHFSYPANYQEILDAADAALARIPHEQLIAVVQCDGCEDTRIETPSVPSN